MTQDLSTIQNNPTAINALFGFEGKPKPIIPTLKVNGNDEEGAYAPKGTFVLDDGDRVLYANEVIIRSYVKSYQYQIYDAANPDKNDRSTIEHSFKGEFRSISGKLMCGKMQKKKYEELGDAVTSIQKYYQENVKCKLLLFGVVSGQFTDLDTKAEVDVKDQLFFWTVAQSGFMDMDRAINGIARERRAVPLTPIKISLKKEKNGSVVFFVPVPNVTSDTVQMDVASVTASLEKINKFVKDSNTYVTNKYNSALRTGNEDKDFATLGEILEGSSREIADDSLDAL